MHKFFFTPFSQFSLSSCPVSPSPLSSSPVLSSGSLVGSGHAPAMAITMTRLARGGWVQLARGLECLRALPALSDASILAPRPPTWHGCVSGPQGRRGLSTGEKDGTISSLATSSVGRSDQGSTSPRFYKRATAARDEENEGLWCVKLDGRKLRTPSLKVSWTPIGYKTQVADPLLPILAIL